MPPSLNPLNWSDFQFNLLLYLFLVVPLLSAALMFYLLFMTFKIESAREEIQEP